MKGHKVSIYQKFGVVALRSFLPIVLWVWSIPMNAQTSEVLDEAFVDSLYREDQFFFGFSYNPLVNVPDGVSLAAFSGGVELGFIRDMPINERRNLAVGLGAGWAFDNFGNSLFIGQDEITGGTIFRTLDDKVENYGRNRFSMQQVTVPLELRWRTSDPVENSFWRVYLGVKLGYTYYYRSNFEQEGNTVRQTNISEFQPWRVGATLSFGYSTFNFHVYYGLNPLFDSGASVNGEPIDMRVLKFGLMFYIL